MKEFAKKILSDVSSSEEFVLHISGKVRKVKNLIDLKIELGQMSEKEFKHHVRNDRNDFAVWIKDSVGDEKLSRDFLHVSDREAMISLLKSRIDFAISILEEDNKALMKDELKQLKEIEKKSKKKLPVDTQIKLLEKDLKKTKLNEDLEKKILEDKLYDDDVRIIPWDELNPVPVHARIVEFVFGLVIGMLIGLFLARVFWGV